MLSCIPGLMVHRAVFHVNHVESVCLRSADWALIYLASCDADSEACYKSKGSETPGYRCETVPREHLSRLPPRRSYAACSLQAYSSSGKVHV